MVWIIAERHALADLPGFVRRSGIRAPAQRRFHQIQALRQAVAAHHHVVMHLRVRADNVPAPQLERIEP